MFNFLEWLYKPSKKEIIRKKRIEELNTEFHKCVNSFIQNEHLFLSEFVGKIDNKYLIHIINNIKRPLSVWEPFYFLDEVENDKDACYFQKIYNSNFWEEFNTIDNADLLNKLNDFLKDYGFLFRFSDDRDYYFIYYNNLLKGN